MNILLCTNVFEHATNGPARFARDVLALNQSSDDFHVKVLTEDVQNPGQYHEEVIHMPFACPPGLRLFSQFFRMRSYYHHARKIYHEYPFDVLVFNHAMLGLTCARKLQTPVVGMVNDDNHVGLYTPASLMQRIKKQVFRNLEKRAVQRQQQVIVNSNYLKQQLTKHYNLPPEKIRRLYKGVEVGTEPRFASGMDQPIQIFFLKADYERGGLDLLAQALAQLSAYTFEVIVAGPFQHERNKIMAYFHGLHHVRVHFQGPLPHDEAQQAMQQADIFCVPSYREALGVANIEALAMGTSVVTTDAGGIPEVTNNGANAWVAPAGDARALASQLRQCIESPEARQQKSKAGYEWVKQHFTQTQMLHNFQEILKSTLL